MEKKKKKERDGKEMKEMKETSTHPYPGGRKNTEIVHRVYAETTSELKENISSRIIIE